MAIAGLPLGGEDGFGAVVEVRDAHVPFRVGPERVGRLGLRVHWEPFWDQGPYVRTFEYRAAFLNAVWDAVYAILDRTRSSDPRLGERRGLHELTNANASRSSAMSPP
jgi:hypothetical protein